MVGQDFCIYTQEQGVFYEMIVIVGLLAAGVK